MPWANPAAPNLPDFLLFVQQAMQIPAAALPITVAAPAAPSLTAATIGGSLPSSTVYGKATYVSLYGETSASPESTAAVTGPTGQVIFTAPPSQAGATGWNAYAALATGAEVLQNTSPVAIGTGFTLDALVTGTAAAPSANTAGTPWPGYAFDQAVDRVLFIPAVAGLEYTLAVYNCAGHILLRITPDQPGQTYFATARQNFGLLAPISGVLSSTADQGTSNSMAVPEQLTNLTIGDLNFYKTPWGREYLAYAQDFGAIGGLT